MPRASSRPSDTIRESRLSLAKTTIMLVGINNYDHLRDLNGPHADIGYLEDLFTNSDIAIYSSRPVISLTDLTCEEFRQGILDYSVGRSAGGDILILYFSGHGSVIHGNEFGFCFRDTRLDNDGAYPLPLSVVPFKEVVRTLEIFGVNPVIIIDACYSGMAVNELQHELELTASLPHGIIASSSYTSTSIDQPEGGPFTSTLIDVLFTGLDEGDGSLWPFYTIQQLEGPLRNELANRGLPIHQLKITAQLPTIPLATNNKYDPRIVRFTPQYKGIVLMLWNQGNPIELDPNQFRDKLGTGATNNHSKLSYGPWNLLEDVPRTSHRALNERGKKFAQGKLKIPKRIYKDPNTDEWKPHPGANFVAINDIGEPSWK